MKNKPNSARRVITALILSIVVSTAAAQAPNGTAVQDISYEYIQTSGTNASAVIWVPSKQMYVTVIAGSEYFPLEGFNSKGENIFAVESGIDVRGLWYNPSSGNLEINGAGEIGWKSFSINDGNTPSAYSDLVTGSYQPDLQSIGTYDAGKKKVIFLDMAQGGISMHSRSKPSKVTYLPLKWVGVSGSNINMYSVGYTGHKGYEFVVLDYVNGNLVFFNRKGDQTATAQLPAGAPLNDSFAFSFTNDRAFLYDKDARIWYGYKVF